MAGAEASPAPQPTSKWLPPMEPTRALYRNLFASRAYERSLSQGAALGSSKSYVFFVETITKKPKKAAAVPMAPSRSRDRATNSL